MTLAVTLGLLVVSAGSADGPSPSTLDAYKTQVARSDRSSESQVKLALWCEQNGLEAERIKHLARAVLTDPNHEVARALLGLVRHANRWKQPDVIAAEVRADLARASALAEYNARREKAPETANAQWQLALWCGRNGLEPEARAHLSAVVRLDPTRKAAWEKLGCRRSKGQWLTPEQIAREALEADAQRKADAKWLATLRKWKGLLQARSKAMRAEADDHLAGVTDPRATRAVWAVFAVGDEADQSRAVTLFGQIDGPEAALDLAALAVYSRSVAVRGAAAATLVRRDPRDVVGPMIDLIHTPLKYEVRPVNGPGRPGALFVEGERFNIQRIYPAPLPPDVLGMVTGGGWRVAGEIHPAPLPPDVVGALLDRRPESDDPGPGRLPDRTILRVANPNHGGHAQTHVITAPSQRNMPGQSGPGPHLAPGGGFRSFDGIGTVRPFDGIGTSQMFGGGAPSPNLGRGAATAPLPGAMPGLGNGATNPGGWGWRPTQPQPLGAMPNPMGMPPATQDNPDRQRLDRDRRDRDRGLIIEENWRQARLAAASAEQQLEADLTAIQTYNADARVINERVAPVLLAVTGQDLGPDRQAWSRWWVNERGYVAPESQRSKPTFVQNVPPLYQPDFRSPRVSQSCFAAGTPVRTLDGPRPIESLKIGDQVLCQDTASGALSFQPVLRVFHNQPAPTLKVDLGNGGTVVATAIHRFWLAGKGWAMARELKPGDAVRTLGGTAAVAGVTADAVQPVFNLEVAESHTFFVGESSALVHDNSLVPPVLHPFDSQTEVAATTPPRAPAAPQVHRKRSS